MVRFAAGLVVITASALALAGCIAPPAVGSTACTDVEARMASGNAPLIPPLRGQPESILATLLAALGDAPTGKMDETASERYVTTKTATLAGAEAWVHATREGRFAAFGYEVEGHGGAFTEARAKLLLGGLTQALGLQGLEVKTEAGPTHNSFGSSIIAEAMVEQHLGSRPVSSQPTWSPDFDPHWDLPAGVAVRLWWNSYGDEDSRSHFNETSISIDAVVEIPPAHTLLAPEIASEAAHDWVKCRLAGSWLSDSVTKAQAHGDSLRALEDSLGYVVDVEYGPTCPDGAFNPHALQWETHVVVDATSAAILKALPGQWNCIGIVSPHGAPLGLEPNDERGGGLGTPATKDPHIV